MGLTAQEKRLQTTASFMRFGNLPARVSGNKIVIKGRTKKETDKAFKLAKNTLIVKKFNLKIIKGS